MSKIEVVVMTPQFNQPRGARPLPAAPKDWASFKRLSAPELKAMGMKTWCDPFEDDWPHQGKTLFLFPADWYDVIPEGTTIAVIPNGHVERFARGVSSDDRRFGCLAYGLLVDTPEVGDEDLPPNAA